MVAAGLAVLAFGYWRGTRPAVRATGTVARRASSSAGFPTDRGDAGVDEDGVGAAAAPGAVSASPVQPSSTTAAGSVAAVAGSSAATADEGERSPGSEPRQPARPATRARSASSRGSDPDVIASGADDGGGAAVGDAARSGSAQARSGVQIVGPVGQTSPLVTKEDLDIDAQQSEPPSGRN